MRDERIRIMHCARLHLREAKEAEEQRLQQQTVLIEDNDQCIRNEVHVVAETEISAESPGTARSRKAAEQEVARALLSALDRRPLLS